MNNGYRITGRTRSASMAAAVLALLTANAPAAEAPAAAPAIEPRPFLGIYLHDEELQKQTAKAAEAYKAIDVRGGIKAALDSQRELDRKDLEEVVQNENAMRERAMAELIDAGSKRGTDSRMETF